MANQTLSSSLVDLANNVLIVKDIQFGASSAGVGATGISLSSQTFSTETLTGIQTVASGNTTATAASAATGILLGTDGFSISFGTGNPSGQISAITGSLYLNKGGSSISSRMYINSGGTTWTFVSTGA